VSVKANQAQILLERPTQEPDGEADRGDRSALCSVRSGIAVDREEEPLTGGGTSEVTRLGDVVFRSRGPGSDRVEHLLTLLEGRGFAYAPRFLGIDSGGRQMVRYMPGEAGTYPLSAAVRSRTALRSAARVLRSLHDTGQDLAATMVGGWLLPDVAPAEVVCHGDFAPYNCVFDGADLVGIIDFDAAHTGPRLWDIAYAVYRFAPLTDPDSAVAFGTTAEQAERAGVFCDSYGLRERSRLVATVIERLYALVGFMRAQAAAGNAAFRRHLDEGHDLSYLRDIEHLRRNERAISEVAGRTAGHADEDADGS